MNHSQNIAIEVSSFAKNRRAARVLAVQCLYGVVQIPEDVRSFEEIIEDIMRYALSQNEEFDQKYFLSLIKGCYGHVKELRDIIQTYLLENWKVSRLPEVIHAIMVLGAYELIYNLELPHPVIIYEYVDVSKIFNHQGESGFINGVLDKISKQFPRVSDKQRAKAVSEPVSPDACLDGSASDCLSQTSH